MIVKWDPFVGERMGYSGGDIWVGKAAHIVEEAVWVEIVMAKELSIMRWWGSGSAPLGVVWDGCPASFFFFFCSFGKIIVQSVWLKK